MAVEAFAGSTSTHTAVATQVEKLQKRLDLSSWCWWGPKGC